MEQILDENHYVQDMSDITDGSSDERSDDSLLDSDGDDHHSHRAAKRTGGGKKFSHTVAGRRTSVVPPTSGGKYGRRKSSLKDPMDIPRKSKKNVSMADEPVTYTSSYPTLTARPGGGKKFSQAHLNAMAKANGIKISANTTLDHSADLGSTTVSRAKPKPKQKPKTTTQHPGSSFLPPGSVGGPSEETAKTSPVLTLLQLQRQQEWHILQVLEDASKSKALPTIAARFKRKLHLKRLKAFLHLPLFDMETYMRQHLTSSLDLTPLSKHIPPDPYELRRQRQDQFQTKIQKIDHTPYGNSFASRLLGQPANCLTRKPWEPLWKSPFSGKVLKEYIWRDYESRSTMMDVLDEIRVRKGKPAKLPWAKLGLSHLYGKAGKKRKREESALFGHADQNNPQRHQQPYESDRQEDDAHRDRTPIDYCYFRKEHLSQVNETLCRRFWPGIDSTLHSDVSPRQTLPLTDVLIDLFLHIVIVTEALQYPEFSVVVLYKRLVVGCAFMTPEGYITYVAVSAGWEKAGIGQ